MAYDPYDSDQVSDRKVRSKARATQAQSDLKWVIDDPRGRRVLKRILDRTGWDAQAFVPGDALATAFREGQRNIGLSIRSDNTNLGHQAFMSILSESITDE